MIDEWIFQLDKRDEIIFAARHAAHAKRVAEAAAAVDPENPLEVKPVEKEPKHWAEKIIYG